MCNINIRKTWKTVKKKYFHVFFNALVTSYCSRFIFTYTVKAKVLALEKITLI